MVWDGARLGLTVQEHGPVTWRLPNGRSVTTSSQMRDRPTLEDIGRHMTDTHLRRELINRFKISRFRGAAAVAREIINGPKREYFHPNSFVARLGTFFVARLGTFNVIIHRRHHEDGIGTLWQVTFPYEEAICVVEVVDAVPMRRRPPGGKRRTRKAYKRYWLRVPVHVHTAREAVAWTFGMTPAQYKPIKET